MAGQDTSGDLALAPELVDAIVVYLQDEPATLRSTALVSRTWCQASRPYLFGHIDISTAAEAPEIRRLADYMDGGNDIGEPASPELPRYTHSLSIASDLVTMEYAGVPTQRAVVDLLEVYARRGRLTRLNIYGARRYPVAAEAKNAIEAILTTQPLTHVSLPGSELPVSLDLPHQLAAAALKIPSLVSLRLGGAPRVFGPYAQPRSIALKSLSWYGSLDMNLDLLRSPMCPLDLSALESFENLRPDELDDVAIFLRGTRAGSSINSLAIAAPLLLGHATESFDIGMTPRLRNLQVKLRHTSQNPFGLPWLCNFIRSPTAEGTVSRHPLEQLRLQVSLRSEHSMALVLHSPAAAVAAGAQPYVPPGMPAWVVGWDRLDNALAHEAFYALRDVRVHFINGFKGEENAEFLPELFPELRRRGVLVTFSWAV